MAATSAALGVVLLAIRVYRQGIAARRERIALKWDEWRYGQRDRVEHTEGESWTHPSERPPSLSSPTRRVLASRTTGDELPSAAPTELDRLPPPDESEP